MAKMLDFYAYPKSGKVFCRMYQTFPDCIELAVFTAPKTADHYKISVKQKDGFSWKCYKRYIACDSGNAADIMKLFEEFPSYASATVRRIIFKE